MSENTDQEFDPEQALARYRELNAFMNVELLTHPEYQARRERDDYGWLQTSKYFIEQDELVKIADEHGYDILEEEDEETGEHTYEIVKQDEY